MKQTKPRKTKEVHAAIKKALGYSAATPDATFLASWKRRATHVCKPCWELKYCPYGPFVEQSPLLPPLREEYEKHIAYLKEGLAAKTIGEVVQLSEETRQIYVSVLKQVPENPAWRKELGSYLVLRREVERDVAKGKDPFARVARSWGRIEESTVPFPLAQDERRHGGTLKLTAAEEREVKRELRRLERALETGVEDHRRPLDPAREKAVKREIAEAAGRDLPQSVPAVVKDMECNVWGHICPVVFVGESVTETSDRRRRDRYISFSTKMRVVRRDNHTCQECGKHLRDDEVEFDHVIPLAKGGSSDEQNIRLTCFDCNRDKSAKVRL
jgi:hypothetical protein